MALRHDGEVNQDDLRARIMGCWLGKAIGGTLGQSCEGAEGLLDFDFYDPVPSEMVPNDDLDLQVVFACVLAAQEREREVVTELVEALCTAAPDGLEPPRAQDWAAAADDAGRLRAVVDAVAGLTDAAAVALHRRLVQNRSPGARRGS